MTFVPIRAYDRIVPNGLSYDFGVENVIDFSAV